MKVSILMATFNKFDCLPNTIVSITNQLTTHELQLVVVDDVSLACPYGIFNSLRGTIPLAFLPLNHHVGFKRSLSMGYAHLNSDAVIIMSCDTMFGDRDLLQTLIDSLEPGVCTMPEVRNLPVSPDLYQFPELIPRYLNEDLIQMTKYPGDFGEPSVDFQFYAGPRQPDPNNRWYFFLGAILKKDLDRTTFSEVCYDVAFHNSLKSIGMKMNYIPKVAIHQTHRRLNRIDPNSPEWKP